MKDDIAHALEGNPPEWFPSDKQIDFRSKRRDMSTKMTLDDLCHDIQGIIEMHGEHFADANYWKHEYAEATINGIPDTVGHDLAILARYVYAAILDKKKGLPLLLGDEYAGLAIYGEVMHEGRKKDTIGPVRKFIRKCLTKKPTLNNEELWTAIKAKPPRDWTPMDNTRYGRYIENTKQGRNLTWRAFCNYAAKERGQLNSSNSEVVKATI